MNWGVVPMGSLQVALSILALVASIAVTHGVGWLLTHAYPLFEPIFEWHYQKYFGPHPDPPFLPLGFTFIVSCYVTGAFLGGIVASIVSRQQGLLFALLVALSVGAGTAAGDLPLKRSELQFVVIMAVSALIGFYCSGRLRHNLKHRTTVPSVETISNHESERKPNY